MTCKTRTGRRELYPYSALPIVGDTTATANAFDLASETFLLGFRLSTARLYRRDLEHWRDWIDEARPLIGPLQPTSADLDAYQINLQERGYSPHTIRRRIATLERFLNMQRSRGRNPEREAGWREGGDADEPLTTTHDRNSNTTR